MRILHVSNFYPPHFVGGYEIAAYDTVDALREIGHECLVLTTNYQKDGVSFEEMNGVHRVLKLHSKVIKLNYINNADTFISDISVSKENCEVAKRYIDSFKPDIVYFWNVYGIGLGIAKYLKESRIPYTFHLLDLSLLHYQATTKKTLLNILGRCSEICSLNRLVGNYISASQFISNEVSKIIKTSPSIIPPYLNPRRSPVKSIYKIGDPISGVYFGQIEKHKGVDTICQAVSSLNTNSSSEKIVLTLYGASYSDYCSFIQEKYSDYIRIIIGQPRDEIVNGLPLFDFGIFPSIWDEPFGIAQIELMQAGLPVFTTGRGGSVEALDLGNHILFEAGDADDLAKKMLALFNNYERDAMVIGLKAAAHVGAKYSKEEYVMKISKYLNNLA